MRSAEQLRRTVSEYHEWQAAERQKHLRELLAMLRRAREDAAEWYVWIVSGRPAYTVEEYAALVDSRRRAPRPASREADS